MQSSSTRASQILESLRRQTSFGIKSDSDLAAELAELKVLARNPIDAPPVYTREGIRSLAKCAFDVSRSNHPKSSLEAARVIANALLLQDQMQQILADTGQINNILAFYALSDVDHEFLGGRILFLLTYKSNVDFASLIETQGLVRFVRSYLWKHATALSDNSFASNPMMLMALTETLKLLYNIASKFPEQMKIFSAATVDLLEIISKTTLPPSPLDPPVTQILNALAVLDWPNTLANERGSLMPEATRKLVQILDSTIMALNPRSSESTLVCLVTVLRRLHELSNKDITSYLQSALLPRDEERDKPLGQSDSLASRLLQVQTSGGFTVLPDAVSGLFFDLSDRDATKFVHNIGYGHAAGYLMTHKIPVPEGLGEGTPAASKRDAINPITGQRLEAETPVTMPEMTDEEKEREAERLYVLFERLRATGVVDVENPVTAAQQAGRFEELSDSEPD